MKHHGNHYTNITTLKVTSNCNTNIIYTSKIIFLLYIYSVFNPTQFGLNLSMTLNSSLVTSNLPHNCKLVDTHVKGVWVIVHSMH